MVVQDNNTRIVKTFLTSVTMNMILMFLVCGFSLQQAMESPLVMALVAPLKGLQLELVFNDQWTTKF